MSYMYTNNWQVFCVSVQSNYLILSLTQEMADKRSQFSRPSAVRQPNPAEEDINLSVVSTPAHTEAPDDLTWEGAVKPAAINQKYIS